MKNDDRKMKGRKIEANVIKAMLTIEQ